MMETSSDDNDSEANISPYILQLYRQINSVVVIDLTVESDNETIDLTGEKDEELTGDDQESAFSSTTNN